jgi:hypothetical protein
MSSPKVALFLKKCYLVLTIEYLTIIKGSDLLLGHKKVYRSDFCKLGIALASMAFSWDWE